MLLSSFSLWNIQRCQTEVTLLPEPLLPPLLWQRGPSALTDIFV